MTNYEKYFGSPERAAEALCDIVDCCGNGEDSLCKQCKLYRNCEYELHILSWLRKETND